MSGNPQGPISNAATAFIEFRLRLIGDRLPEGRKDPNLQIRVDEKTRNEVNIICNTGLFGSDQKQISILAKLGAFEFGLVKIYAEEIHSKEPGFKFPPIRCYGPRKKRSQSDSGKGIDGVVLVGKDQQGQCYISLMRKDPPHVRFVFRPGKMAEMIDPQTNAPLDQATVSNWYSRAWAEVMGPLAWFTLAQPSNVYDYRADQQRSDNGGGYGGGGNGGGNAPAASSGGDNGGWDDDIPM